MSVKNVGDVQAVQVYTTGAQIDLINKYLDYQDYIYYYVPVCISIVYTCEGQYMIHTCCNMSMSDNESMSD